MWSKIRKKSTARAGGAIRAAFFATAIIALFLFSYLNLFELQLGMSGITAIRDDADTLYGMRLDVYGIIDNVTSLEFQMVDVNTGDRMYVVWLGQDALPPNGTEVKAQGQLVQTSVGAMMLADNVSLVGVDEIIFSSVWVLPTLRLFTAILLWFLLSISLSCLLAIIFLVTRSMRIADILHAVSETSVVAGIIAIFIFILISLSEHLSLSASSYILLASPFVIAASVVMREMKNHWIAMFADAIPLIAGAMIVIWLLLSAVQGQMLINDFISSSTFIVMSNSFSQMIVGLIGLAGLGFYIMTVRIETMEIMKDIDQIAKEVK